MLDSETSRKKSLHPPRARPRTQRVLARVPVWVYGCGESTGPFQEITVTEEVYANGGVILLAANVQIGQDLILANVATGEEQHCQVIAQDKKGAGHRAVRIEFKRPAPRFWHIFFPRGNEKFARG